MVIALAPAFSAILVISTALILSSSQPALIFTVTGILTAELILDKISPINSGYFKRPEPLPSLVTLSTGHPQFKSIVSNPKSSIIFAESLVILTFEPHI